MSRYEFEYPYVFALLILFWICFKRCPARGTTIYLPYIHLLVSKNRFKSRWLLIFQWVGIVTLITSLASPVKVTEFRNDKKEGRDIMIILDSSESMNERGFDDSNLTRDKFTAIMEVISKFIEDRTSDRVGLINFSSSAFIASPLTFDKEFLKDIISKQRVGIVGKRTAIYDALLQGLYILEGSKGKSKIALLLTDGIDNMSQTTHEELLEVLKDSKIKLYIIGIGEDKDLDISKLKSLAKKGNGAFYLATNKGALETIYKEIDQSETTKIKGKIYKLYIYYFYFPLIVSIISMLLFIYFKSVMGVFKR